MKLLILGNIASGKTTLAKKISKIYNVEYYEMDNIVYDQDNNKRSSSEQKNIVTIILKNREYIIEGMLRNYYDLIIPKVSTIIFLDYNKKIIRRRLFKRYILDRLGIGNNNYKLDKELYNKFKDYQDNYDNSIIKEIINKYPNKLIIIKNNKELKKFFKALDNGFEYKEKI